MGIPAVIPPEEYLTEADVLARWPMLKRSEIRRARKANPPLIAFYAFHKAGGGPRCTASQVQEYIDRTYLRGGACQSVAAPADDSRSATTISISPTLTEAVPGTHAAMSPDLMLSAAKVLRQQILNKQNSSSRPSSPPRRKEAPHKARLRLIKS